MASGDQRGDSEGCSWSLIMSTLGRDAFLIPSPPRCLSSPSGHPHPPPSAPMESPGHMASGLFSETDALTVLAFLQAGLLQEEGGSLEGYSQSLRNFEHWLQEEHSKLVRIIAMKTATAEDLRTRETKLQVCAQGTAPFIRGFASQRCVCCQRVLKKKKKRHIPSLCIKLGMYHRYIPIP